MGFLSDLFLFGKKTDITRRPPPRLPPPRLPPPPVSRVRAIASSQDENLALSMAVAAMSGGIVGASMSSNSEPSTPLSTPSRSSCDGGAPTKSSSSSYSSCSSSSSDSSSFSSGDSSSSSW